jgi:hypothetical protein
VVAVDLHSIFSGLINLALLAGGAIYAGLVVMDYRTDGPHPRPRVDLRDPAHSAERLAVWMGVKTLTLAVQVGTPIFGMLSEASADVGEWFLSHRSHESR